MSEHKTGGRANRARLAPGAFAIAASILLVAALRGGPARARAATVDGLTPAEALDAPRVAAFLAAVRGTGPVPCELAARSVDGRGNWWGRGDGIGPSSVDSAARALASAATTAAPDADAVPVLRDALGDADACVRRLAAPLLGRVDDPSAMTALLAVLRAPAATARQAAAIGLAFVARTRASEARAPLLAALSDADATVRTATAWALGRLELPGTATPISALLRDRDASVRRAASYALGALEDAVAIPALVAALRDDADAGVRMAAAWALGQIK